ncbi:MAG: hypothetical protein AB1642_11175 [Pseudomonadota bacterium]
MRLAFFLLLLVNAALFVWGQGYWDGREAGREPERMRRQIEADRLRILTETDAAPAAAEPVCKRIQWLSAGEADAVQALVAALPGWEAGRSPRPEAPTYWVVIAELGSRALAEKKKGELRQLGVNEGEIVENAEFGPFAVSLGVFRGQQTAEEYLQAVGKKGVRSARLLKRDTPPEKFALDLRAGTAEMSVRLAELMAPLAQAELVECPGR